MKKILILFLAAVSFLGCAPTHTLKEVVNDPTLLIEEPQPNNAPSDNPIMAADQWIRKNLW